MKSNIKQLSEMKRLLLILLFFLSNLLPLAGQSINRFDILSFTPPAKFVLKEQKQRLVYEQKDVTTFCQIHLWPAQQGSSDPEANFKTDWDYFACAEYIYSTTKSI